MTNEATTDDPNWDGHKNSCIGGNKGPCNCGATDERYPYYGDAYKLSADGPIERFQSGPVATDEQRALGFLIKEAVNLAFNTKQVHLIKPLRDAGDTVRLSLTRDNPTSGDLYQKVEELNCEIRMQKEAIRVAIGALESAKWTIYGDLKTQKEATLETIDKAIEALGEK